MNIKHYSSFDIRFIFTLVLSLLIVISGIYYTYLLDKNLVNRNQPVIGLANEAQMEITQAHLWLEEYLFHDSTIAQSEIEKKLNDAKLKLTKISEGSKDEPMKIRPIKPVSLRDSINLIQKELNELHSFSIERMTYDTVSHAGSLADAAYDKKYSQVIDKIQRLISLIHKEVNEQSKFNSLLKTIVIIIIIAAFVYVVFKLNRYILQRNINAASLEEANEELKVQNNQLKTKGEKIHAQNEEIRVQNEELDKSNKQIIIQNATLKQSEERLKLSLKSTMQGIWDLSLETGETLTTEGLFTMLGYANNEFEFTFDKWKSLLHPDDKDITISIFNDFIAGNINKYEAEFRLKTKDGDFKWILSKGKIVEKDTEGKPLRVIGTHLDIHEKKKTQTDLKQAAEVFENIQLGLFIYKLININDDRSLLMVDANPAIEKLIGLKPEHVVGKTLDENFPGLREKGIPQKYAEVIRTQTPIEIEDFYYSDARVMEGAFSIKAFPLPDNKVGVSFENIIEKKHYEIALKENEEKYRSLFTNAYDAILLLKDYVFIDFNEQALKLYGCSKYEDLYLKSPAEYSPEFQLDGSRSSEKAISKMEAALKGYKMFFEWTHTNKKGDILETEVSLSHLLIQGEDYILAIVRDITDKKKAEIKIRETEERWKFALEGAGDGVWDWNAATNEVIFSNKWKEMLGYETHEIEDKFEEWDKRLHPDDREQTYSDLDKHLSGQSAEYINEHRLLCKEGKYKWILARGKVIEKDQGGNPLRVIGTHTDISNRKKLEQKLKLNEERISRIIENTGQMIYRMKLPEGNYEYVSSASKNIFGYSPLEMYNNPLLIKDIIHSDFHKYFEIQWNNLIEGKMPEYYEYKINHKNGGTRWIYQRNHLITNKGEAIAIEGIVSDVTERKNAERALKEREEIFQSMFKYMNSGVAIYQVVDGGNDFVFKDFNQAAERITHVKKEEVIGEKLLNLFPNMKKTGLYESLQKVYKTGQSEDLSAFYYKDNKREGWRDNFIYKLPSGDIVAIFEDVTDKINAERALKESREKYHSIFLNTPLGIIHYDRDGFITDCNENFVNIIGSNKKVLIGLNMLTQLIDKSIVPEIQKSLDEGQGFYEGYYKSTTADKITPIRCFFKGIVGSGGSYSGGIGLVEDVSERMQAQEALQRSESVLFETQKIAKIASFEYYFKNKEFKFSKNFADVLGIENEDIENFKGVEVLLRRIHPEDKEILTQNYAKAFTQTNDFEYSYRSLDKENNYRYINTTTRYEFDSDKKPLRFITVIQDYTQQKRNEELKNEIEIAEETANIKQQFLANMSHEIRTPMTGIIGMIDFLAQTQLDLQQRDYVQTIKDSSESLMNIVNDVLNLSKIEAGKLELLPKVFRPVQLVREIQNLYKVRANEKGIEFTINLEKNIPEYLYADEYRLKQVVSNLVSNAIKYTEYGYVKVSFEMIKSIEGTAEFNIKVKDTGVGISEEDKRKVFTKFTQFKVNVENALDGIGLGLVISKELVEHMGGKIGLESKLDEGSMFWFTFKANIVEADSIVESDELPEDINLDKKVLLAEDKAVNQKVITLMLNKLGCNVTIVNNGKEALEIIEDMVITKEEPFDLILMDIQMPVMDGITAVKKMRKNTVELPPIIGLSANAMEGDAERYISEGLDDYLSKPVSKKMLYDTMLKWFRKSC